MDHSIVYFSRTGNTARLAEALREALGPEGCRWFGPPDPAAAEAPVLCVGFWTDKGICSEDCQAFLRGLRGKTVFLFGTAGFGGDPAYYEKILANVKACLDGSNTIAGTFMCQGQMMPMVRARYEQQLAQDPANAAARGMLETFDRAVGHPDAADLAALCAAAHAAL